MTREELELGMSVSIYIWQKRRVGRVVRLKPTRARVRYSLPSKGPGIFKESWFQISTLKRIPFLEAPS